MVQDRINLLAVTYTGHIPFVAGFRIEEIDQGEEGELLRRSAATHYEGWKRHTLVMVKIRYAFHCRRLMMTDLLSAKQSIYDCLTTHLG